MAVISLDLSSTATCPKVKWARVAQALTTCNGAQPLGALPERRRALPSMAMWPRSRDLARASTHCRKQAWKAWGSRRSKTRSKVSWEGMPLGRARKVCSQSWRRRPKAATCWPVVWRRR